MARADDYRVVAADLRATAHEMRVAATHEPPRSKQKLRLRAARLDRAAVMLEEEARLGEMPTPLTGRQPTDADADVTELAEAVQAASDASDGDSNDAQISALSLALAVALRRWPEISGPQS
jgi:hypothetical protein